MWWERGIFLPAHGCMEERVDVVEDVGYGYASRIADIYGPNWNASNVNTQATRSGGDGMLMHRTGRKAGPEA
jgi:hypothetical protein